MIRWSSCIRSSTLMIASPAEVSTRLMLPSRSRSCTPTRKSSQPTSRESTSAPCARAARRASRDDSGALREGLGRSPPKVQVHATRARLGEHPQRNEGAERPQHRKQAHELAQPDRARVSPRLLLAASASTAARAASVFLTFERGGSSSGTRRSIICGLSSARALGRRSTSLPEKQPCRLSDSLWEWWALRTRDGVLAASSSSLPLDARPVEMLGYCRMAAARV